MFELPEVVPAATEFLTREGVANRTQVVGGDFFESVPAADYYILMRILQNWTDRDAVRILRSCREAVNPGGHILIVGKVIEADAIAGVYPITDIHQMVETGGRERSREQFRELLDRAGFQLDRVIGLEADLGDGYPPSALMAAAR